MYTGQQYVDGVRNSLDDPNKKTWTDAKLLEFVNDTREDLWLKARWNFKKSVNSTLDSVASQASYVKPTTIRVILGIAATFGGTKTYLKHITLDEYLARTTGLARTGRPTAWFSQGANFILDPIPSESATNNIDVHGYGQITRLALADTEANLNEDFYLAIKYGTIGAAWDADEDDRNADPYYRRYLDQIKTLKRDYVPEQIAQNVGDDSGGSVDELDPQRMPVIS